MYKVYNIRTGVIVASCKTLNGARRSVDRLDNEYGAYVHSWKLICKNVD